MGYHGEELDFGFVYFFFLVGVQFVYFSRMFLLCPFDDEADDESESYANQYKIEQFGSGEFQTEDAVKKGSAMLVIVAEDASANTKKLFHDKCSYYEVPVYEYGTKEELGWAIGRNLRSSVGVCDAGLADALIKQLEANLPG